MNKDSVIKFRLTEDEKTYLKDISIDLDMSLSQYIRYILLSDYQIDEGLNYD